MWIEILKTGTFKDSKGEEVSFDSNDLNSIANNYNSNNLSSPVTLGHPKDNSPAMAWVERLQLRGEKLLAKVKDVSTELIESIKSKRYNNVSVSLSDKLKLNHIGVIGGMPPAVDGLQNLSEAVNEFTMENLCLISNNNQDELDLKVNEFSLKISELEEQIENYKVIARETKLNDLKAKLKSKKIIGLTESKINQFNTLLSEVYNLEDELINNSKYDTDTKLSIADSMIEILESIGTNDKLFISNTTNNRSAKHKRVLELMQTNPILSYEEALALIG
jgi:hypothetical protein